MTEYYRDVKTGALYTVSGDDVRVQRKTDPYPSPSHLTPEDVAVLVTDKTFVYA